MKSRFLTLGTTLVVFIALYLVSWARFRGFGSTVVLANVLYTNSRNTKEGVVPQQVCEVSNGHEVVISL